MNPRDHGFQVETDMDHVVVNAPATRSGLTTEQVLALIDDLGDAVDDANGWTHYNPHEIDRTDVEHP